ncbi:MAG: hypothetical protein XD54_1738 [Thermococcus sibiricus]|uniref:Uncharacterized protein n=1 Tax=Thermococcus sibiricus TaxID=172049 RepID=A0A101EKC0_9EURY|nr:MAG: hypothetical protein XD54_1738 [Thermococcus sibiricus]
MNNKPDTNINSSNKTLKELKGLGLYSVVGTTPSSNKTLKELKGGMGLGRELLEWRSNKTLKELKASGL